MKILIVGLVKGSQIQRFREEGEKLGHHVDGCFAADLVIKSGGEMFEPSVNGKVLSDYDLIYLCTGVEAKRRYEWYIAADYLKGSSKTKIVNEATLAPSFKYYPSQTWFYFRQFKSKIPQPKTYTVFNDKNLKEIASDLGFPVIVKLSETHQGKGVFLAKSVSKIKEIINDNLGQVFLLREFIPNDGDIRVFTVGFRAIGAMRRIPAKKEFRSNLSRGGRGEPLDFKKYPQIKKLAEKSAKISNVEIAGVDIIIDKNTEKMYVLEVNVGPQFKGLEKYTKVNAASEIIKYFTEKN